MTDPSPADGAIPVRLVTQEGLAEALDTLDAPGRAWAAANGFTGRAGQVLRLPDAGGALAGVLVGLGDARARARARFQIGAFAADAPAGAYVLQGDPDPEAAAEAALGWRLSRQRFTRYKGETPPEAMLEVPGADAAHADRLAAGVALARRLVDTPAEDMGPAEIEAEARALAAAHGAEVRVIAGDDLLAENLPLIHAVGRAAARGREPRLIELRHGPTDGRPVALVGKGVAFDTGGLNLKPGASMGLMKKDMGGAANVLGLAAMLMAGGAGLNLRVLIPAVENSVSGASFRPGDVLRSRAGLTVEVNNTDAEGRLVLADALALAGEESPELTACFATLTGAARVALGPDVPALFTDDDGLAARLATASARVRDPLWRLPLHAPYEAMIEPQIADLDNAPAGGMAGAITAALFLQRFKGGAKAFSHVDLYAWTPTAAPGRPKGGEAQTIRAFLEVLEGRA